MRKIIPGASLMRRSSSSSHPLVFDRHLLVGVRLSLRRRKAIRGSDCGRPRLAGGTARGEPAASAGGGLPDARQFRRLLNEIPRSEANSRCVRSLASKSATSFVQRSRSWSAMAPPRKERGRSLPRATPASRGWPGGYRTDAPRNERARAQAGAHAPRPAARMRSLDGRLQRGPPATRSAARRRRRSTATRSAARSCRSSPATRPSGRRARSRRPAPSPSTRTWCSSDRLSPASSSGSSRRGCFAGELTSSTSTSAPSRSPRSAPCSPGAVSSSAPVTPLRGPESQTVNDPVTPDEPLNARAVNA